MTLPILIVFVYYVTVKTQHHNTVGQKADTIFLHVMSAANGMFIRTFGIRDLCTVLARNVI